MLQILYPIALFFAVLSSDWTHGIDITEPVKSIIGTDAAI